MTHPADRVLTNAIVHTTIGEEPDEAIAIRDGQVIRTGTTSDVDLLVGVETDRIDCDGRTILPGFIDAHTHLRSTGRYVRFSDLSAATDREEALESLASEAAMLGDWYVGVGYDESQWPTPDRLTRTDLDAVSETHPVVAYRVDMHTASLNSVALDRLGGDLPEEYLDREGGRPTGIILEDALDVVREAMASDDDLTRELLLAGQAHALEHGITCIHDFVRGSTVPRTYRELDRDGKLSLRIRLNYWRDHLDAVREVGLISNHGCDRLRIGAIKSFSDGSIGARTARLTDPYVDDDGRGQWVVSPAELQETVDAVDAAGMQLAIHAIGDAAIEETLSALEWTANPGDARHRIEHVELASDDHIDRMATAGIVASMQPNFHQWGGDDGLYERRLGEHRRRQMNRFNRLIEAGVHLAFGSDSMPMDPLYGIHCAVTAPGPDQSLSVDEAVSAYTAGSAYAGFDEDRLGTLAVDTPADLVVLDGSPWDRPDQIDDIDVWLTLVNGAIAYDDRRVVNR